MFRAFVTVALLFALGLPAAAIDMNSRGEVAMGVGEVPVSFAGRLIGRTGGDASWATDDVGVFASGNRLYSYDKRTGDIAEAAPRGANAVMAGGGVWAAWLAGYGVYTSTGLHLPEAGLLAVGPDGSIAYTPDQSRVGANVRRLDGSEWRLTNGIPWDVQLLGGDRAIWREGSMVRVIGLPQPQTVGGMLWRPRAVFAWGEWWISYLSEKHDGLVIHPFKSTEGWIAAQGANIFAYDVVTLGPAVVRYAWSTTEGERLEDLRLYDAVEQRPRIELRTAVPPPPPPPPPPPVIECGTVPVNGQEVLRKLAVKFQPLVRSTNDDERRQFARKAAEQMAFNVGPEWGTKSAGGGRPQSKDAIAKMVGDTLCSWDIVNGATRELVFGRGEVLVGQEFIEVEPVNHLGATFPVEEPNEDPRIKALELQVADLTRAVEARNATIRTLTTERDGLQQQFEAAVTARDAAVLERNLLQEALNETPNECRVTGPGWVRSLFNIRCELLYSK